MKINTILMVSAIMMATSCGKQSIDKKDSTIKATSADVESIYLRGGIQGLFDHGYAVINGRTHQLQGYYNCGHVPKGTLIQGQHNLKLIAKGCTVITDQNESLTI